MTTTPTIVHTTDLVDQGRAFDHSVALARASGSRLISLHANAGDSAVEQMRDAGSLLARWGLSPNAVEFEKRVHRCCDDPVETILDGLERIQPDLVVAATHQRNAIGRFFAGSRAEAIAHNVSAPALLFSTDARSFVARETGSMALTRILVPLGDPVEAAAAIRTAKWFAALAGAADVEFVLLHVGALRQAPSSELDGLDWHLHTMERGDILENIVTRAETADLVVMATRGHDSLADILLGSHTDRVLHAAKRPVLSVGVHG